MSHTPGPWKQFQQDSGFRVNADSCQHEFRCITEASSNYALCLVLNNPDHRDQNDNDNASLIAAAPDLMTAVRAILDYLDNTPGNLKARQRAVSLCRQAVAKATGASG